MVMYERAGAAERLGRHAGQQREGFVDESGSRVIDREIEARGRVAAQRIATQVARPVIERIERQRFGDERVSRGRGAESLEDDRLEIASAQVGGVEAQGPIEVIVGGGPIVARAIDFGEGMIRAAGPRVIPRGFVEGIVSGLEQAVRGVPFGRGVGLVAEAATKLVKRFAVGGIGISQRVARNAGAQVRLRGFEFAATQMPAAEREVATGVAGIAAQRFTP